MALKPGNLVPSAKLSPSNNNVPLGGTTLIPSATLVPDDNLAPLGK